MMMMMYLCIISLSVLMFIIVALWCNV